MKTSPAVWLAALLSAGLIFPLHAQGTAFTYQGRLADGASPANRGPQLVCHPTSDRNVKQDFEKVEPREVLEKVEQQRAEAEELKREIAELKKLVQQLTQTGNQ